MTTSESVVPKTFFILTSISLALFFGSIYYVMHPRSGNKLSGKPDIKNTATLIEHIKAQKKSGHLRKFTFVQETIKYNGQGTAIDTSTWYEAIRYPKDFRIDFGNAADGNTNISRNDSIYVFRNHELVHQGEEIQEFLILEGGVFYYPVSETIEKLEKLGVNTSAFSKSSYKGNDIYIIGAEEGDLSVPQIWLHGEHFHAVRRVSKSQRSGNLYDVRYDGYKNFEGHLIETWIEFYRDGKILQTERYYDIDVNPKFDDKLFDPKLFGKYHWFND